MKGEELLNNWGKLRRQKLIRFIHDKGRAFRQVCNSLTCKIKYSSRCSNNDVNSIIQTNDIVHQPSTTSGNHNINAKMLSKGLADLGGLQGKLSSGDKDESLCFRVFRVYAFEGRNDESGGFSCAVFRSCKNVSPRERNGDGLFLNWGRLLKSSLKNPHHQFSLDVKVLELEALGGGDILGISSALKLIFPALDINQPRSVFVCLLQEFSENPSMLRPGSHH